MHVRRRDYTGARPPPLLFKCRLWAKVAKLLQLRRRWRCKFARAWNPIPVGGVSHINFLSLIPCTLGVLLGLVLDMPRAPAAVPGMIDFFSFAPLLKGPYQLLFCRRSPASGVLQAQHLYPLHSEFFCQGTAEVASPDAISGIFDEIWNTCSSKRVELQDRQSKQTIAKAQMEHFPQHFRLQPAEFYTKHLLHSMRQFLVSGHWRWCRTTLVDLSDVMKELAGWLTFNFISPKWFWTSDCLFSAWKVNHWSVQR